MNDRRSNSRGKWLAAALVTMGIVAALAEWKFRPRPGSRVSPAATQPATR